MKEAREEVFIPKGYAGEEQELFVSVNGVNYLLPKGKASSVPTAVAKAIRRAQKAQQRQSENMAKLLEN